MSDFSDSENEDMVKVLEAADTILLRNDLFKTNSIELTRQREIQHKTGTSLENDRSKSQRFLYDTDTNTGTHLTIPEAVQKNIAKKLTEIIHNQVEFYNCTYTEPSIKVPRSRVKLLSGFDCYAKSYDEFEYDTKGADKKPQIRRRRLSDEIVYNEAEKIKAAVISPGHILNATDVHSMDAKKNRSDKVFHYILASGNTLHAKETITEFTQTRRKNKWNASKIKRA